MPSTRRDGIPIELERTVLRCLDKNPDDARDARRPGPHAGEVRARPRAGLARAHRGDRRPAGEPRPRAPTYADRPRPDGSPTSARMRAGDGAGADRSGRTMSSWGRDRRGQAQRKRRRPAAARGVRSRGRRGVHGPHRRDEARRAISQVRRAPCLPPRTPCRPRRAPWVPRCDRVVGRRVGGLGRRVGGLGRRVVAAAIPPLPGFTTNRRASASAGPAASASSGEEDRPGRRARGEREARVPGTGTARASGRAEGAPEADAPRQGPQAPYVRAEPSRGSARAVALDWAVPRGYTFVIRRRRAPQAPPEQADRRLQGRTGARRVCSTRCRTRASSFATRWRASSPRPALSAGGRASRPTRASATSSRASCSSIRSASAPDAA